MIGSQRNKMRSCAGLITLGFVAACATPGENGAAQGSDGRGGYTGADDPRRGAGVDTVCFSGRLSGFYGVGDSALVLRRTQNERYLVETGFCPNLKQVEGLRLPDSLRCLQRGDRLEVYDTPLPRAGAASDQPDKCLVQAIHEWDGSAGAVQEQIKKQAEQ